MLQTPLRRTLSVTIPNGQITEAVQWWLHNSPAASWKELADALGHEKLASQLHEGMQFC